MRDRLIELISKKQNYGVVVNRSQMDDRYCTHYEIKNTELSDYLLANGVIVPPCKVGDMLFALWSVPTEAKYVIYSAEVVEIRISERNSRQTTTFLLEPLAYRGRRKEYRIDDFGKLVFTNKEEAEQALVTDKNVGSKLKGGVHE